MRSKISGGTDIVKKFLKLVTAFVLAGSTLQAFVGMPTTNTPEQVEAGYLNQDELDNRVIYQTFSLFQPYEKTMYQTLANQASKLNEMGITDLWLPPAYRSFGVARYMEGYATYDRYDLGEFAQGLNGEKATKYGTSDELKALINKMHNSNIKSQMDLVPNQMFGLNNRETVNVTRTDGSGKLWQNPYTTKQTTSIQNKLYLGYTKGAGQGQQKYGLIKEFNKSHFLGTSLQNQGFRTLTDANGNGYKFFGPNSSNNNVPAVIADSEAAKTNKINTVDGMLAVDGWMCTSYCSSDTAQQWSPIIAVTRQTAFVNFLRTKGLTPTQYIERDGAYKNTVLNEFLSANYNGKSEEKSLENHYSGIEESDQFLFSGKNVSNTFGNSEGKAVEFLVGLDVDNANPQVKAETEHWMKWMLDTYKFDGYRIDAASHYDRSVLTVARDLIKAKGNGSIGYMESYFRPQKAYADEISNELLTMNYDLYFTMEDNLAKNPTDRTTDALLGKNPHLWTVFDYNNNYTTPGVRQFTPNWSFVNNHDQEKNRLNRMMMDEQGITTGSKPSFEDLYDADLSSGRTWEKASLQKYWEDVNSANKKWTAHNVLSQYAYMLSMKGTVPTLYYGDMYRTDAPYMSVKTPYNDGITEILKARKTNAKGPERQYKYKTAQTGNVEGQDLIANVREGNTRNEGMAVVISDNPLTNETIQVNVGKMHTGQKYRDILGRNTAQPIVDADGNITIQVKGTQDVQVSGQIGVWVPVVENTTTKASFEGLVQDASAKTLNVTVNATLDNTVLRANQVVATLKSDKTGWTYTLPTSQVTNVAGTSKLNLNMEQTLFSIDETYSIFINGSLVKNGYADSGISYFQNGHGYNAKNINGNLNLQIVQPLLHRQEFSSVLSRNNSISNFEMEIFAAVGDYNLDVSKSVITLESDKDKITIPASGVKVNANNNKLINISFRPGILKVGQTYKFYIDGRAVTATMKPIEYVNFAFVPAGGRVEYRAYKYTLSSASGYLIITRAV